MQLNASRVLLTGATGGIGRACALALAGAGAQLILVARDVDALAGMAAELPGSGHIVVAADLATPAGRAQLLAPVGGHLDMLVNCAGVNHFGLLQQQSETELAAMLQLNALVPMLLARALLPVLLERESVIVNMGSTFGSIGYSGYCGYCGSKAALRGFSEALGRELADTSVAVYYLAPRSTATTMNSSAVQEMNRELGNSVDPPEAVAAALLDMLRSGRKRRYIGWPERFFVTLNGLFPGVVDAALARQLPLIRRYAQGTVGAHD